MNHQQKLISDIMTRNICQVGSKQTVIEALAHMRSKSVSSVLVIDGVNILGIITERDLVAAVHSKVDLKTMNCAGLMQSPVVVVPPDISPLEAYHHMARHGIRHLAITSNTGKVVGLISEGDLMHDFGIEFYMHFKKVGSIMSTDMVLLTESDLVADAVEMMIERHQSCILVVDANRHPIGVLTERDVVWLCGDHVQSERMALGKVMRSPVKTVVASDLLHDAVKCMATARIRRLAVVDDAGVVIGLLTHHEIVREMERDYDAHRKAIADMQLRGKIQFKPIVDERLVLATLSRLSPDTAILAADLNFHIGYAAQSTSRVLGLDPIACLGLDLRDALKSIGWHQAYDDVREAILTDGLSAFEATLQDAKLAMRVFLMHDVNDDPCGFLVNIQRNTPQ